MGAGPLGSRPSGLGKWARESGPGDELPSLGLTPRAREWSETLCQSELQVLRKSELGICGTQAGAGRHGERRGRVLVGLPRLPGPAELGSPEGWQVPRGAPASPPGPQRPGRGGGGGGRGRARRRCRGGGGAKRQCLHFPAWG